MLKVRGHWLQLNLHRTYIAWGLQTLRTDTSVRLFASMPKESTISHLLLIAIQVKEEMTIRVKEN